MALVPFVGPSYKLNTPESDVQRVVNMYPVANEVQGGKTGVYLEPIPGLDVFSAVPTPPAGGPWLFFNEEDGSEPINQAFGSFVELTTPVPFVDGVSAVSYDGFGQNDTFVNGPNFALPLYSLNAVPGPGEYDWAPAGGPALEPTVASGNPDSSTPQWSASNGYVSLGFTSVPSGWLGGVLTLYTGNDATGASGATVITFITGSTEYPPVSIEYVGPA